MTQGDLLFRATATDAVARYFRKRPLQWVEMPNLVPIGGLGAWRTEVSRCRQAGMNIQNITVRGAGCKVVASLYCYVPGWYHPLSAQGQRETGRAA